MRKPWDELTAEEKAAHRRHLIETARPDIPKDQVERVIDLLQLDQFDWENRMLFEPGGLLNCEEAGEEEGGSR